MDININQANMQLNANKQMNIQNKLNKSYKSENDKELLDACREFEAIFTHTLLKEMRATVTDGGLTEKSSAREMFEDMYDEEISKEMAKSDGIGIAKMLYEQMTQTRVR